MENFKKRLISEIIVACLIVAALLVGIFFFEGNINSYLDKIAEARSLLAARTQSANALAALQKQYNSGVETDLTTLTNVVPTYDSLINLNSEFQSMATPYKFGYGFSFAGETAGGGARLGSLGYNLTVSGAKLADLMSFLNRLTNFHDLSSVDNVSINTSGQQITMVVNGRVYYR